MDRQEPVAVGDLRAKGAHWPEYVVQALASELLAVVAVPLRARGRVWGALDLYRRAPRGWSAQDLAAAQLLADVATSYLVMAADRDEARSARREIEYRSLHDQLTGLPNRGLFMDRVEHALTLAARRGGVIAVAFLDLDRFKEINDVFGHAAGDTVLVELTHRMTRTLRSGDTLARLAGDEFVLLCEDLPASPADQERTVMTMAGRLRAVVAQPVRVDNLDLVVSASIGVTVSGAGPTVVELLADADTAMYEAKARGRNTAVVRNHTTGAALGFGRQLERDFASALDGDQLRLHYQPVVATGTGRIHAVEALLRWQHPEHGLLTAQQFIHLAETTGALIRVGGWVIDTACAQLAAWRREFPGDGPEVVFCNLSPRELSDPTLRGSIATALRAHQLTAKDLGLEIVEDAFSDPLLTATLGEYSDAGHPLAVDDFGTGYSSLSRLIGLPVTYAKIDKSFVAGLPDDARCRGLVDAVVTVARSLDLRVIAEGVETEAQQVFLTGAGCDLLQGYRLAAPVATGEMTLLLRDRHQTSERQHPRPPDAPDRPAVVDDDGASRVARGHRVEDRAALNLPSPRK